MKNVLKIWAVISLVGLVGASANASTINIKHTGYGAHDNVVVYHNNGSEIKRVNAPGGVYMFDKSGGTGEGNYWQDGQKTVFGFCMDLYQYTPRSSYATYNVIMPENGPDPYGPMGTTKADYLRELWAKYFDPSWVGNGPFTYDQNAAAEAFDVCIWEIIYENPANGYDVTSGDFYVKYYSMEKPAMANAWLNSLTGNGPFANLRSLSSHKHQDMLTQLPEPATLGLIVIGMATLTSTRRKMVC